MKAQFTDKKFIIPVALLLLIILGISLFFVYQQRKENALLPEMQNLVSSTTVSQGMQEKNEVTFVLKAVGPLEPDNQYPELSPNPRLSEEVRLALNKRFKDETEGNSCVYGEVDKDLLIETLQRYAEYSEDIKKHLSKVDLKTLDDEALRKLYVELKKPESYGTYRVSALRNGFIFGTKGAFDSYCGWEMHSNRFIKPFIIDLTSGQDITLGDLITVDNTVVSLFKQKVEKEYKKQGGDASEDNACFQYLHKVYFDSYEGEVDSIRNEAFAVSTTTFTIVPSGYPWAIEGVCNGTGVDISFTELEPFIKNKDLLKRLTSI